MKKLAVIIPYRDRKTHLDALILPLTQALNKNHLFFPFSELFHYQIFVIEQTPEKEFNRGKIKNIGFTLTQQDFDFFCFHDVDMIPLHVDYSYPSIPTHLAANVTQFKEWVHQGLAYPIYFGGVVLFNKADFIQVNGYSNEYWGYGAEDDDLILRVIRSGLKWTRRPGQFESQTHPTFLGTVEHSKNTFRYERIVKGRETDESGLSNLEFSLKQTVQCPTHTIYQVEI